MAAILNFSVAMLGVVIYLSDVLTIFFSVLQNGTMTRMTKFEIELPVVPKPAKLTLSERDIAMATM